MKILNCLFGSRLVLGLVLAVSLSASAQTFTVVPNGSDDTAAIQAAFDNCVAAGPGCTVQLASGTFHSSQVVVNDFHGTFKGMGKDATILEALPDLVINQDSPFWLSQPSLANPWPFLISFVDGDITISDMSFKVTEFQPTQGWNFVFGLRIDALTGAVLVTGSSAKSSIERIGVEGGPGTFDGVNLLNGVYYEGITLKETPVSPVDFQPLSGTHSVTSSSFRNLGSATPIAFLKDARVTIGGAPPTGNTYENVLDAFNSLDVGNTTVEFSHNEVLSASVAGVSFIQGAVSVPTEASQLLITHNNFNVVEVGFGADGILIVDLAPLFGAGKSVDVLISQNTINTQGIAFGGIDTFLVEGAVISNNRLSGSGTAGILVNASTQCMLLGNNVENFTAAVAPIWLLEGTSSCTTVGGKNKANVFDQGTDNILVGVNNMFGNDPGQEIKEAMKRKLELLKFKP